MKNYHGKESSGNPQTLKGLWEHTYHRYEGGKVPKRTCRPNPVAPLAH